MTANARGNSEALHNFRNEPFTLCSYDCKKLCESNRDRAFEGFKRPGVPISRALEPLLHHRDSLSPLPPQGTIRTIPSFYLESKFEKPRRWARADGRDRSLTRPTTEPENEQHEGRAGTARARRVVRERGTATTTTTDANSVSKIVRGPFILSLSS